MGWWADFDRSEVATDFTRIATAGLDSVRLFLTWEDFQPTRLEVDSAMLDRLVAVADLAGRAGLVVVPTLFMGHMSGVNWIPSWALGGSERDHRFRIIADGKLSEDSPRNWYADDQIAEAQVVLAREAAASLAGHEALWAWDLGNESSNCVVPPSRPAARRWLQRLATAIREADPTALVTIGLHMEDLENDRRLGPADASGACDLLSMHGYPIYTAWADGSTDEHLLPFLAHVTRWLGNGRDVLFSEFGLPTYRIGDRRPEQATEPTSPHLVDEEAAAAYTQRALRALREAGCAGAMVWCYTDYAPDIWGKPPIDLAVHERSFGLWRADGSPKPAVAAIQSFAGTTRLAVSDDCGWIDIDRKDFFVAPERHLRRLYGRYRQN